MDLINEVIEWACKEDPKDLKKWEGYLRRYLKEYGWNKKAIDMFMSMGDGGFNYNLLHIETNYEDFYGEVHYCSDRMSIDRLLRCHVQYRTIEKK